MFESANPWQEGYQPYESRHAGTQRPNQRLRDGEGKNRAAAERETEEPDAERIAIGQAMPLSQAIYEFQTSNEWTRLAPRSREFYAAGFEYLEYELGDRPLSLLLQRDVEAMRDRPASPSVGNRNLSSLKRVLGFAERRYRLGHNPSIGIKPHALGHGHRAWTPQALKRFRQVARGPVLTAFLLGLYLGQRKEDILSLTWDDYQDNTIFIRQRKTGAELSLPVHPRLSEHLARLQRYEVFGPNIVTLPTGKRFSTSGFRYRWKRTAESARTTDYTFHGLRSSCAIMLAYAGCNHREIALFTGHRTMHMVQHYIRDADKIKMGELVMRKVMEYQDQAPEWQL